MAKAKTKKKVEKKKKKVEWPKLQKQAIDALVSDIKVDLKKDKLSAETYTNHHLKIVLTDEQLLAAGRELAATLDRIVALENDKAAQAAHFKSLITEAEAQADQVRDKVRNGYMYGKIDCVEVMNNTTGMAHRVRTDNFTVIEDRKLTASERQGKLFV